MCDSGVFNRGGAKLSYGGLFEAYRRSGVDYGIIIDELRNAESTIRSARRAMEAYKGRGYRFKLVGVAQGKTIRDYLRCYDALRAMGYRYIAIGGLLNRRRNTARYVYVRGGRLFRILQTLREKHPRDWMFALGVYHPRRHGDLDHFKVYGSDYKGWVFNYEPQNELGTDAARSSRFSQVRRFLERHVYSDTRVPLPARNENTRQKSGRLVIVACSKRKVWDSTRGSARAEDAYKGAFFHLSKEYARRHGDFWVILSGKYGFVSPGARLRGPYDMKLNSSGRYDDILHLRSQIVNKQLHMFKEVVVLGGQSYIHAAKRAFSPFAVSVVTPIPEGMRLGMQLQFLKEAV